MAFNQLWEKHIPESTDTEKGAVQEEPLQYRFQISRQNQRKGNSTLEQKHHIPLQNEIALFPFDEESDKCNHERVMGLSGK
jgi:hypothetical protein